jgi:hypothetical protein
MCVRPARIQRLYSLELKDGSVVTTFENQEKGLRQSAISSIRSKLQHMATSNTHDVQVA